MRLGLKRFLRIGGIFALGAAGYPLIEIAWRGRTHILMALAGGICIVAVYYIARLPRCVPIIVKSLVGAVAITAVELSIGLVANRLCELNIWDYSTLPHNLFGQICLLYSWFWFLLCIPLVCACRLLGRAFDYADRADWL